MIERHAPAKLNLGLEILRRRADGYHEIETVFVPLRLADRMVVRLASAGTGIAAPRSKAGVYAMAAVRMSVAPTTPARMRVVVRMGISLS